MQPNQNEQMDNRNSASRGQGTPWPLVAGALVALGGVGFGIHGTTQASRVAESQSATVASMSQMQDQMRVLNERLSSQEIREKQLTDALAAERAAAQERQQAAEAAVAPSARRAAPARPAAQRAARRPAEDPRFKQLEQRLSEQGQRISDQDQKLANANQMMENTRTDLENRIAATSDSLSGSIARTSDEVAALRRRGERDYYEFDIAKSKLVQRVGPMGLALRKADTKRKRYNVDMMFDDNKLEKKNVNLLEPVFINSPDYPGPVELVVNRIDKNRVTGYVSVPKYKRAELSVAQPDRTKLAVETAKVQ